MHTHFLRKTLRVSNLLCLLWCMIVYSFSSHNTHTQNKEGEIKHVYRGNVFVQARQVLENAGIIACKAKHVELAGGTSNAMATVGTFVPQSPRLHSPAPHRGQGSNSVHLHMHYSVPNPSKSIHVSYVYV